MGTLIEQQEAVITAVEDSARDVEGNTEKAYVRSKSLSIHLTLPQPSTYGSGSCSW